MNHVSFSSWAPLTSLALQPEAIRDLAQLDYRIKDGDIGNVLLVARQSALTLRCLAITAQQDISALVHDDGYVAYPCLDTLDLNLQAIPGLRLVTNGVLFPNLRRLSIRHEYPFADDTLFRGNAMALEFLRLMPSRHVCDVIREFDVFTASSHPKMDCVKIDQLPENTPSHFESSFAYLQFVLDIAPRPKILDVGDIPGDGVFALRLLEPYSSIRVLALPHLRLELLDVVSIVHWLPHLSDLYTRPVALGMLGDGVLDRFPDRMCALYRPDRVALRCWHLDCWQAGNTDVLGVLGVALMCPQFNHVALAGSVHAAFMKLMEEIIESGGFKRYAPRLRLLLFARQF
ncbi:hypothetical protein FBU31_007209 [Coemansia sp. 'formosensis']|nr:hypothetical protein FBU31_007209 [Coemansia sp. 'formosensis']